MKFLPLLLCSLALVSVSCETAIPANNSIQVAFKRMDSTSTNSIKNSVLKIKKDSTLIFEKPITEEIRIDKSFVIDSLEAGLYFLEYNNILGEQLTKQFALHNNTHYSTTIVFDSLPLQNYVDKTPIYKLSDGDTYRINMLFGGGTASWENFYSIERVANNYYYNDRVNTHKLLTTEEIQYIQEFESGLYAIRNSQICSSTASNTYTIMTKTYTDTITDHTCNWQGYEKLMSTLKPW